MSYDTTDLGYELGYDSDCVAVTPRVSYQCHSEGSHSNFYSFDPLVGAGTAGAVKHKLPLDTNGDDKIDADEAEKKDEQVPSYRPDSKAELSKMEKNRRADMPFFFESAKGLNTDLDPQQTQDAQYLSKQGVEDKYVQKSYLGLIDKKALEVEAKRSNGSSLTFEEMGSKQLHEEAARSVSMKTYQELKKQGYSNDAIKDYMVANGMIEPSSNIPPKDKMDFHLPRIEGTSEIDYEKFGPYDVARHYNNLGSLGDGAPHAKAKNTKEKDANNAYLKSQAQFTTAREKWISNATTSKAEGGLGWSRSEAEKVLGHMGLMGDVKDPEAAAQKLFTTSEEGKPVISTNADGVTEINGKPRVPESDVTPADYKKMSTEDQAKFDKEHPIEAGVLKTRTHAQLQSKYQKAMTDKPPHGTGYHPHEANGILSSKFTGDPPLFDVDGRLKTADEMGISQEAYEARLSQLDDKIATMKKETIGKAFVLDEKGDPVQEKVKGADGKWVKATDESGNPIYQRVSKDSEDQAKDIDKMMSARDDWRDDKNQEARDYHRERAVEQMRKIGVDEKNMEMILHGRNLLSDEADPTEIAKFADELEKVPAGERKNKKTELLKEVKDNGYNAPEDNSTEGQNFAKFKTGKDDKKGGAGGAKGKDKEAQLAREHQTSERIASEKNQVKRDKEQRAHDKEMKEFDADLQREMAAQQKENQKELALFQEEIEKRKEVRQFGQQAVQQGMQNLWQTIGNFSNMSMQNAFQSGQAITQGTYQMIAASQPRPFDLVVNMLGGQPRR